jgi:hypothetical protein
MSKISQADGSTLGLGGRNDKRELFFVFHKFFKGTGPGFVTALSQSRCQFVIGLLHCGIANDAAGRIDSIST